MDQPLLLRKYSIYLLNLIKNNPGKTKTELIRMYDPSDKNNNERTKFVRLQDLEDEKLIENKSDEREGGRWNSMYLYITPKGQRILNLIQVISDEMEHDENKLV